MAVHLKVVPEPRPHRLRHLLVEPELHHRLRHLLVEPEPRPHRHLLVECRLQAAPLLPLLVVFRVVLCLRPQAECLLLAAPHPPLLVDSQVVPGLLRPLAVFQVALLLEPVSRLLE